LSPSSHERIRLEPITLRFSRLVGDVLREVPADWEPQPKYKFYM
jgi:hypothetical protein